jgi:hypothetical protein
MNDQSYVLNPINGATASVLRAKGGPIYVADNHPGYPCRQCLEDAQVGEELVLVSHDPFGKDSVYRSASPIFLHRSPCSPTVQAEGKLPIQLTRRQLSVRSFDEDEMMISAEAINGTTLLDTINSFFADERSHRLHVHNASRGCWAVAIDRR